MAGYGSWEDRPGERREGGREWERSREERQRWGRREGEPWRERSGQDLGARGREEWRGEEEPRGREWRAYPREEGGRQPEERRWTEWEEERDRRGRDWRGERDWRSERGRWGASDWRPESDRPWLERGPTLRGRGDTRGLVEWEDRGPLAWLGDKLRAATGRRPRGPKGYTRSDERIHEEVCERIARSGIDADNVEVRVEKREVTLTGTVGSREEKWWLEELADDVFGVEDVHNQIRVSRAEAGARGEGAGMPH